jgi:hypothetical protein
MRKLLCFAALGLMIGLLPQCDDDSGTAGRDLGVTVDMAVPDLAAMGPTALACLEQPEDELPRPPATTLPCELIPPALP